MCLLSSARRLTEAQHFNNWWILLFGRVTGGIATSLLFSVFEAWMVRCSSFAVAQMNRPHKHARVS